MPDTIDQFIAMPKEERGKLFEQLSPDKQRSLLEKVKQRKSAKTTASPSLMDQYYAATEPYTRIEPHDYRSLAPGKAGQFDAAAYGRELLKGFGNIGATGMGAALHPYETAKGLVRPLVHLGEANITGDPSKVISDVKEMGSQIVHQPLETVEQGIGMALPLEAAVRLPGALSRGIRRVPKRAVDIVSGTGPSVTKELVKQAKKENIGITEANRLAGEKHLGETQEALHETEGRELKYQQEVKAANEAAERAQAAADQEHNLAVQNAIEETRQREDVHRAELSKARMESQDAYDKKLAEVVKANRDMELERKAELKAYFEKTKELKNARERGQDALDRKVAINRGIEQVDKDIKSKLKDTEDSVNAEANRRYNNLAKKLNRVESDPQFLPDTLTKAAEKIKGSDTETTLMKDMERKIKRGETITYEDLQGYRSELGRELRKGTLPGDVFTAYKVLQEDITGEMQRIADNNNLGSEFRGARDYYRRYAEAFIDRDSPIRKAIDTEERGQAVAKFQGKDISGVEQLAQFNAQLARRINTVRRLQSEASALKAKPVTAKTPILAAKTEPTPLPEKKEPQVAPPSRVPIPDRPDPVEAKQVPPPERVSPPDRPVETPKKKISGEEIRQAKQEALQRRAEKIQKRGAQVVSTLVAYQALSDLFHGNVGALPKLMGESSLAFGTTYGISKIFQIPKVVELLTNPTAADIAKIPPELRGNLLPVIQQAQKQGLKVDPALLLAITGSRNYPLGPNTRKLQRTRDQFASQ